jgi:curved DNA-binding protein CbpA
MTIDQGNIDQGLFKFDFTDHHAILGVSLEADAKQIRKRYLKIARKLHPDSLGGASDTEKQQASEFLSKMVNPAYEKLTQDKAATEYKIVLKMQGQQLKQQQAALQLQNPSAKALASSSNATNLYNSSLKPLAEEQYSSLEQVLVVTGQISELNLAYLVSTAGQGGASAPAAAPATSTTATSTGATAPAAPAAAAPASPRQHRASIIGSYLNRAKEFEQRKDYSKAILELREAVKSHPNNADCHAALANLYLKANQATMARIHLKKALGIDPNNAMAKGLAPKVNKAAPSAGKASGGKGQSSNGKKEGGGLFGLFGGKGK